MNLENIQVVERCCLCRTEPHVAHTTSFIIEVGCANKFCSSKTRMSVSEWNRHNCNQETKESPLSKDAMIEILEAQVKDKDKEIEHLKQIVNSLRNSNVKS